ncbi:SWI SNF complex subunit SWI3B, putative [Babesia ovata]|uniref:SWI SNF complex subunit SWI3B, putative n=1 Tax=Babesia ovata TaxID=189622 RepID=A0A2H6KHZ0_9APIC|nr:SWI SNF complex subunit SWI3B, putative [Babesia ovata]GBE62589.1 SWI SNF complex subunit SWI3B, putative [Babesia ovata]
MPREHSAAVGLANTTELHHHKDDFVTMRMDVTTAGYLKDGSRLCQRTTAALDRLPPCAAVLSFGSDTDERDVELVCSALSMEDCAVTVMEPSVSTYNCGGKQESALLDASSLLSTVNEILEAGRLPEPTPTAVSSVNAETVAHGRSSQPRDEGKRRKVAYSEDEDIHIPDEFEHFLKHKELLFKAHRTLSNEKNRKLETIRNVMNELSKAGVHFVPEENIVQKLRHGVDRLLFRALTSRGTRVTPTGSKDSGSEYVVSAMRGTLVPPEKLFDMFRSACEHLGQECPVFVLCATSARSPRQNAHCKELGSAFTDQHLYIICCWDPPSDMGVIVLTSQ